MIIFVFHVNTYQRVTSEEKDLNQVNGKTSSVNTR